MKCETTFLPNPQENLSFEDKNKQTKYIRFLAYIGRLKKVVCQTTKYRTSHRKLKSGKDILLKS